MREECLWTSALFLAAYTRQHAKLLQQVLTLRGDCPGDGDANGVYSHNTWSSEATSQANRKLVCVTHIEGVNLRSQIQVYKKYSIFLLSFGRGALLRAESRVLCMLGEYSWLSPRSSITPQFFCINYLLGVTAPPVQQKCAQTQLEFCPLLHMGYGCIVMWFREFQVVPKHWQCQPQGWRKPDLH